MVPRILRTLHYPFLNPLTDMPARNSRQQPKRKGKGKVRMELSAIKKALKTGVTYKTTTLTIPTQYSSTVKWTRRIRMHVTNTSSGSTTISAANVFGSSGFSAEAISLATHFDHCRLLSAQLWRVPDTVTGTTISTRGQTGAILVEAWGAFADGGQVSVQTQVYPEPMRYSGVKLVWDRTDQQYDQLLTSANSWFAWSFPSLGSTSSYEVIIDLDLLLWRQATLPPNATRVPTSADPAPTPVARVAPLPSKTKKLKSVDIKRLHSPGKVIPIA